MFQIVPMFLSAAEEISGWQYPGEYAIYSFEESEEVISELTGGEYVACLMEDQRLAGYFCYGASARVPAVESNAYEAEALDMGLGLRPDLCGAGLGMAFMGCGMAYARERLGAKRLRLTVACFNKRAMRLYEKMGFVVEKEVKHSRSGMDFYVMEWVYKE